MSGLFVYNHAEAVRAQGCDVRVICSSGWRDMLRHWRTLRREGWMPDIVQVNVIQKQGLLAKALREEFGIPFIIVEHWSGYMPENGQFMKLSRLKRQIYRHVCRDAEQVLTVSMPLQRAMQACGMQAKKWGTIDNVVDEEFFEQSVFSSQHSDRKTLLHVSCFDERAKNVKGLLRAAKMLSEKRQDWRLVLIGTGVDYTDVRTYAEDLQIPEGLVEWTGELEPKEVADWMHKVDALVLSSRYETYGVVLAEAAAAGLPILSTPVGIAEELGALIVPQEIAQNKAGTFAEFMETVLFSTEVRGKRLEVRERFSADSIGKKLKDIYDSCLHRDI